MGTPRQQSREEFEAKFYELWCHDQDEEERKILWYPKKRPTQTTEEYLEYLWIVSDIESPAVLEIGVKNGHQRRFYEELLECRKYIGLDINGETSADVVGDSRDPKIVKELELMEPFGWDIIFVDGNHSRAVARADYETYKKLVRPGGFLVFHDTHHDHAKYCDGAAVLWNEIKDKHSLTWDIYHEVDYLPWASGKGMRKQCGIGLIRIP
jgi:hypothetical protein